METTMYCNSKRRFHENFSCPFVFFRCLKRISPLLCFIDRLQKSKVFSQIEYIFFSGMRWKLNDFATWVEFEGLSDKLSCIGSCSCFWVNSVRGFYPIRYNSFSTFANQLFANNIPLLSESRVVRVQTHFVGTRKSELGLHTSFRIGRRKVRVAGITEHPSAEWVEQQARNMTGFDGELSRAGYLIHDRDSKYTARFDHMMKEAGIKPIRLPLRSPNLNSVAERFVLSIKSECLDRFIPIGEKSLRLAISNYMEFYHAERPHQSLGNKPVRPENEPAPATGRIACRERLGGLLKHYFRQAAWSFQIPAFPFIRPCAGGPSVSECRNSGWKMA